MAHFEYLIRAERRRPLEHGGSGGGLTRPIMFVPDGLAHAARDEDEATLCGLPTASLVKFADVFEHHNIDLCCGHCRQAYNALDG